MKRLLISALLVFATATASAQCNTPAFPTPLIKYLGATDEPQVIRFWFGVVNFAQYDNTLFVKSPNLPACGANTSASRTWLYIFNGNGGAAIYGYCGLSQNLQMQKLNFAVKKGTPMPKSFFIRMTDRKCNRTVQSNTLTNL